MVVIDSLNGYLNAMPEERFLTAQLHELLTYLGHKGVVTFLVVAQHGLVGHMESPIDTTYLADTVILFRYFEAMGEVRQAISVLKKRSGKHERTIRELSLGDKGITIGQPLKDFQGVLSGTPTYRGPDQALKEPKDGDQQPEQLDERVLVLAPTARDAATSRGILEAAGVRCVICGSIEDVCREVERGAGAAVVTAEAILADKEGHLAACLKAQPPWSDFPLVVLTPPGAESPRLLRALAAVGHMTLMKRPVQVSTLISTVQSALRDRRRQYASATSSPSGNGPPIPFASSGSITASPCRVSATQ